MNRWTPPEAMASDPTKKVRPHIASRRQIFMQDYLSNNNIYIDWISSLMPLASRGHISIWACLGIIFDGNRNCRMATQMLCEIERFFIRCRLNRLLLC